LTVDHQSPKVSSRSTVTIIFYF